MTNEQKAKQIAEESKQFFYHDEYECGLACAIRMAKWKDEQFAKEKKELRHQIQLLIDAIDHAYLRLDGTYGNLSYEVSDQVKYVKSMQTKKLMKGE